MPRLSPCRSTIALSLAVGLACVAVSSSARANGRFPAANQLVGTPGKPESLVLRTTFGILLSSDTGKNWDWVCEGAVGYGGIWDPPIAVFGSGTVMAGTIDGLALSPDHGCAWSYAKGLLEKRAIIDVVIRPEAPEEGFVLASSSAGEDDAGASTFLTQVFATTDAGKTWSARASDFVPAFVAQTIEVAKTDPKRVYVSGSIGEEGVVFASTDGASTFMKHTIALERPNERAPYLAAVSPTDANRVYVRTGGASSRLLVSDDGARTFRSVYSGPSVPGFALSPDGTRVWIGSQSGLLSANTADAQITFTKVSDAPVQCLLATGAVLYACGGSTTLPYALATSTDLGATFTPLLTLRRVRGPLACPPNSAAAACAPDWPGIRATLDPLQPVDGGASGDAAAGSANVVASLTAGGGCNASPTVARGSLAAIAAAIALAIARARRRSRSR